MSSVRTGRFKMLFSQTEDYYFIRGSGHGSFGAVARFRRLSDRKLVSIKKVPRKHDSMSIRETTVLAALADKKAENHIVRFYEAFVDRRFCYIVEEALDQTIDQFQRRNWVNKFEVWEVRTMMLQLLIALAKLKEKGVVHTDIKQDNIMLVNQQRHPFRVKLIDFGCSTTIQKLASMWSPCIQPRFVRAPEVILAVPGCNVKIDMWSMGCVMGEMALGRVLFPSRNELELAHAIFETRGLPSARMLETGLKTRLFFDRNDIAHNKHEWSLKACKGRELPSGTKSLRRHVAAKLDSLDAIEDKQHGVQGEDTAEVADRKSMVELLDRMLTLDPDHRITPHQALQHPFLTLQHLSGCKQYRDYYNFSLQRYGEAGVTVPQPPAFRHEDSVEIVPETTQGVPKKKGSFRKSLRSFFARFCRHKKQPVVGQGAKDGLSLEDSAIPADMPVAGPSQAAPMSMKQQNGSKTESANSSDVGEPSTPSSGSSVEFFKGPPKKKGFLRRWLQRLSSTFAGCRGKKSAPMECSNVSL